MKTEITNKESGNVMKKALEPEKQDLCSNDGLFSFGGSRRGARGPLYRKPSIRRAECLGEASKIARLP
jgi:hypothetical protein